MSDGDFLGGHPDKVPLTKEERAAIAALKRLAKRWPKSLWLYSASGSLMVMRHGGDGHMAMSSRNDGDSASQEYIVDRIQGIANDGGDW